MIEDIFRIIKGEQIGERTARWFLLFLVCAAGLGISPGQPTLSGANAIPDDKNALTFDVVLLDKHGRHFNSLNGLNLRLLEDGSNVSFQSSRELNSQQTDIAPHLGEEDPEAKGQLYTNSPPQTGDKGERTLLLIDLLNTPPDQRPLVLHAVKQLLLRKELAAHLTIYGLASRLTLLQDSEGDPETLVSAIHNAERHASEPLDFSTPETGTTLPAPASSHQGPQEFLAGIKSFIGFQQPQLAERKAETIAAFKTIARATQGIPGRKGLIWFSGDFPCVAASLIHFGSNDCSDQQPEWQATFRALQEARLSLYPANATTVKDREKDSGPMLALERSTHGGSAISTNRDTSFQSDLAARDLAMQQVAEATGGRLLHGKSLEQAVEATRDDEQSMEIRFVAPAHGDTGIHRIQLDTNRSGITVLYRRTLYGMAAASPSDDPGTVHQEIVDALAEPLQATGIALAGRKQKAALGVDLFVDARGLTFESQPDGHVKTEFDVATASLSPSYRMLTGNTDRFTRTLTLEELQKAQTSGLLLHLAYTSQPHAQWLRLLVRDLRSGRIGSLDVPLDCCNVLH